MGGNENDKTVKEKDKEKEKEKEAKTPPPATAREHSSTTTGAVNPNWSGFQAYSPMPPHRFLASSSQAHPYMWGVRGSYPFSPVAMPSPNGIAEASGNTPASIEADDKPYDVKEKLPIKRSKGSLGSLNMIAGKNNDAGKAMGPSANGVYPNRTRKSQEAGKILLKWNGLLGNANFIRYPCHAWQGSFGSSGWRNNSYKEKLGQLPGREDFRADGNDRDSNDKQQTEQTDNVQGGQ